MSIFCYFGQFFFLDQFLLSCCFCAFLLYKSTLKRDDLDNLEMEVRNCWWYQGGACRRLTVTGVTVLHMLNLFM